ncbi:UNVERIFIED_CONTAM: hypothetical protein GTU68_020385 [Idotea baltica]|nr:hypothetical protein [Idotea baltica]
MGNKVNPVGMRLQVNRTWDSRWYADTKDYGNLLLEDLKIKDFIKKECKQAGVSRVIIERPHKKCRVTVHTARPGVIIGKKGADIETLRQKLAAMTDSELHLNIVEVRKPELDAVLVGESISQQLERRVSFRRAMKRAVQNAMRMGALGIRVNLAGRLGGAEIARTEWYREGRVPLHTLRADIDYAHVEAMTPYGIIGIKTWIFKGSMLQPKRTKFRKQHKGRIKGEAKGGSDLTFGTFGLKATQPERVTARQIEAARRAMTRHMKRQGRVWIRIFPDVPVTSKPTEVRMGKGKGSVDYWACKVKPGRIMFEIDGVSEDVAREALRLAAMKLPVKTRTVLREDW